jgi:hypothetical protein
MITEFNVAFSGNEPCQYGINFHTGIVYCPRQFHWGGGGGGLRTAESKGCLQGIQNSDNTIAFIASALNCLPR